MAEKLALNTLYVYEEDPVAVRGRGTVHPISLCFLKKSFRSSEGKPGYKPVIERRNILVRDGFDTVHSESATDMTLEHMRDRASKYRLACDADIEALSKGFLTLHGNSKTARSTLRSIVNASGVHNLPAQELNRVPSLAAL